MLKNVRIQVKAIHYLTAQKARCMKVRIDCYRKSLGPYVDRWKLYEERKALEAVQNEERILQKMKQFSDEKLISICREVMAEETDVPQHEINVSV